MVGDFKARLQRREVMLGTILSIPSPETAEMISLAGFDWLFVDLEHGALDIGSAQSLLRAAGSRTPCAVRTPSQDEAWIKKCLDIGACGLIVPHVDSARQAETVIRLSRYPPAGERSVGIGRAHGYGHTFGDYLREANERVALILQIEHIDAVEQIASIVAVPGIDAIFIGPYDLSASMGKTGKVDDPQVLRAIARVRDCVLEAGIPLGLFTAGKEAAVAAIGEGYTLLAVSTDTLLLTGAAGNLLASLRQRR
jgi:2-dehydro-3-deoxyglucarate aldolase/4-hydroxy-2-oxoheptanedioate aldolase